MVALDCGCGGSCICGNGVGGCCVCGFVVWVRYPCWMWLALYDQTVVALYAACFACIGFRQYDWQACSSNMNTGTCVYVLHLQTGT